MKKRAILFEAVSTGRQADNDKQSIPEQDTQLNIIAEQKDWEVVDTILIPGHSRVYYTYREFCDDALAEGIPDPMRMFDHWKKQDFDVFACASGDRFGREQSIFAEVVGRTIDAGAVVFTLRDGEINRSNRRMFVSMGGYQAAVEVDEIVKRRNFGMNKRAERGVPTSSNVLMSHVIIRDQFGNAIRLEVDETKRRLWEDVYRLIVEEHLPWGQLEDVLTELGHTDAEGKRYRPYAIHEVISSPTWWGSTGRFYGKWKLNKRREWGWVYDPSQPVPSPVILHRNTHEAVYTGEQQRKFIAELERRLYASKGRSKPYRSNRYAGVVVCRDCAYYMTYSGDIRYTYITCKGAHRVRDRLATCSNTGMLKPATVEAFIRRILERRKQGEDLATILEIQDESAQIEARQRQLTTDLEEVLRQSNRAAEKQVRQHESQEDIYQKIIDDLGVQRVSLERQLATLDTYVSFDLAAQEQEADEIQAMGENFWALSDTEINARLCRMLGKRRLVSYHGKMVGYADAPRNTRRSI